MQLIGRLVCQLRHTVFNAGNKRADICSRLAKYIGDLSDASGSFEDLLRAGVDIQLPNSVRSADGNGPRADRADLNAGALCT